MIAFTHEIGYFVERFMTEPFLTTSGLWAVRRYVPNRVALGIPMTAKGEGEWVSLPFLSILSTASKAQNGAE